MNKGSIITAMVIIFTTVVTAILFAGLAVEKAKESVASRQAPSSLSMTKDS